MGSSDSRHRRSIRLSGWDYATPGAYFVTICITGHECVLGEVHDKAMTLSPLGQVVEERWHSLRRFFPGVELDAFVVMPNHVHGIIVIKSQALSRGPDRESEAPGAAPAPSAKVVLPEASPSRSVDGLMARDACPARGTQPGSLGAIVQSFKSVTTRTINRMCRTPGAELWQTNYYERIIRDHEELERTRRCIETNPARWDEDEENPSCGAPGRPR